MNGIKCNEIPHSQHAPPRNDSGTTRRVGNSQHSFPVLSGVRQGCVMSALLFNITIDWVMRQTTQDKKRGIRWNLFTNLDDLDFADDLALLSHTHSHIQEKTNRLHIYAKQVGLKINTKKTEVMTAASELVSVRDRTHFLSTPLDRLSSSSRAVGTAESLTSHSGAERAATEV